jgi:Mn2+/Fe2+ NRAMP family transporter
MNEKLEKAKQHIIDNKNVYIAVGVTAVVVCAGTLIAVKLNQKPTQIINTVAPVISPVIAPVISPVITASNNVNFGGYAHKIVKCDETNEMWETVTETAKAAGVSTSRMSRHLNDHLGPINDLNYSIVGIGTNS